MKKLALLAVILLAVIKQACAQIVVAPARYHVDENLKLIVSNIDLADYPVTETGFQTIVCGAQYDFSPAALVLKAGQQYHVNRNGISYKLYFTNLPLAIINTSTAIVDEPKISGNIVISDMNGLSFTSSMGIEVRGGSSQWYPKKSYDVELWQNSTGGQTRDASFFGMREDDDWLLLAQYNEPLRINNMFSHNLWLKMHTLYYHARETDAVAGVHLRYIEVFVNGEYMGIYALTEQIDNKQLKLKKYSGNEIHGELYKGAWWSAPVIFNGVLPYTNQENWWGGFEHKFPDEKVDWANLTQLVDFVVNSSDSEFSDDIFNRVEKSNMIDYFIFLNLLRARDNIGKNAYLAKYSDHQPYFYVPWDLDGVLGYDYGGGRDSVTTDTLSNGLFDRLFTLNPQNFREDIQSRWFNLREDLLSSDNLKSAINGYHLMLRNNNVYEREFLKWNDAFYNEENRNYMNAWLDRRILNLDRFFEGIAERDGSVRLNIYPNPSSGSIYVDTRNAKGFATARIVDARGVTLSDLPFEQGGVELMNVSELPAGMYFLQISTMSGVTVFKIALY